MNTGLMSLNILRWDTRAHELVGRLKPAYVISTAQSTRGHTSHIRKALKDNPGLRVIARGVFDQGDSLDNFQEFIDKYGWAGSQHRLLDTFYNWRHEIGPDADRVWFHLFNETGAAEGYAEFIRWHVEMEKLAQINGIALAHLGHSLGTPKEDEYIRAVPLFEAMRGGRSILNLHEYWQNYYADDVPHVIGRYAQYQSAMAIADHYPDVVMTEWGYDKFIDDGTADGGWYGTGWSEYACAQEMVNCAQFYVPHALVKSLCYFSYGYWTPGDRWWKWYDISRASVIQDHMQAYQIHRGEEPPVPSPCVFDIPTLDTAYAGVYFVETAIKKRFVPIVDDCSYTGETLPFESTVRIEGVVHINGYLWGKIEGEERWCALGVLGVEWVDWVEDLHPDTIEVSLANLVQLRDHAQKAVDGLNTLIAQWEE